MVSVWNILGSFWAPLSKMVHITFKAAIKPNTKPIFAHAQS